MLMMLKKQPSSGLKWMTTQILSALKVEQTQEQWGQRMTPLYLLWIHVHPNLLQETAL